MMPRRIALATAFRPTLRALFSFKPIRVRAGFAVSRASAPKMNWDIATLPLGAKASRSGLFHTPFAELSPRVAPSGDWIVYHSNELGRREVFAKPFPNVTDGRWRISREGGTDAVWSPDGRELFYLTLDGRRMVAVPVRTEHGFSTAERRASCSKASITAPAERRPTMFPRTGSGS